MRRLIRVLAVTTLTLALAVGPATIASAGGGAHCAPMFTDAETDLVRLTNNCFTPTIARVEPGTKVRFVNEDGIPHTVTGAVFVFGDMDEFATGERSFRFEEEGTYPYVCILHPGMAGAIVVGDGAGKITNSSVTGGKIEAPPSADSAAIETDGSRAEVGRTEPAAANGTGTQWLVALVLLVGVAVAWVLWLPRRKTAQLES